MTIVFGSFVSKFTDFSTGQGTPDVFMKAVEQLTYVDFDAPDYAHYQSRAMGSISLLGCTLYTPRESVEIFTNKPLNIRQQSGDITGIP